MDKNELMKAVAVRYKEDSKPLEGVQHSSREADLLIKKALESGIPVREDKELLRQLRENEFLSNIPSTLYGVAAETLMYIYRIDSKFKGMRQGVANA